MFRPISSQLLCAAFDMNEDQIYCGRGIQAGQKTLGPSPNSRVLVGNAARRDASRRFSTLMSHSGVTIMQNDVFILVFSSKCDDNVSQRHKASPYSTRRFLRTCTRNQHCLYAAPAPDVSVVIPPPNLIHYKYNINDSRAVMRPSLLLLVASASVPRPPPGQSAAHRRTPEAFTSITSYFQLMKTSY